MQWALRPDGFSLSCSCPRVCGLSYYRSWQIEDGQLLRESRCNTIGVFFARTWSLPAPVSHGMSADYEAKKGTAQRENVLLTTVGQMMRPLTIESWRKARGCSYISDISELQRSRPVSNPDNLWKSPLLPTGPDAKHSKCATFAIRKNSPSCLLSPPPPPKKRKFLANWPWLIST